MTIYQSQRFKVGLFMIGGLILFTIVIFVLGGTRSVFTKFTPLHARFDNVQGLNTGSIVSLAGVQIGNVDKIEFVSQENKLDLTMSVDSTFWNRITQGSTVEIRTQGALGDKFVYIIPGDPKNPPIDHNVVLEANKGGDFLGMLSEKSGEASKIFDVISETYKLMKSINDGNRVEDILVNMKEASVQMTSMAKEAKGMMAESSPKLKDSIDRLDHVMKKIDSGEGTLGALINDPSIHDQLKTMLGGTSQKKNIKSLLRNSIEKSNTD